MTPFYQMRCISSLDKSTHVPGHVIQLPPGHVCSCQEKRCLEQQEYLKPAVPNSF